MTLILAITRTLCGLVKWLKGQSACFAKGEAPSSNPAPLKKKKETTYINKVLL
jgi:hypothetical protein